MLLILGTRKGERGTRNGEQGTGVWEQVYSGNLPENSKMADRGKEKGLATSFKHALFERDRRSKQHGGKCRFS